MTIEPREKADLLKRYSDRLAQLGPTIATLGWSKPKHKLRYKILLDYWLIEKITRPLRVLDFGCGFGDLFGLARDLQMPIDYTGLDINPDLIKVACERYPSARFICVDLFEQTFDEQFDVVLSSGVHNFRFLDNRKFAESTFQLFDRLSIMGFAANFLSNRVNFQREQNFYTSPEDILSLALQYSPRVTLRHDYMPFEFSIFVDKRSEIDEGLTVFRPFVETCM